MSLTLGSSRALVAAFTFIYGGALLVVGVVPLPWWLRLGIGVLLVFGAFQTLSRHAFRRCAQAVIGVALIDDDCEVTYRNGDRRRARIVDRWVQPWLVMLRVRPDGARWSRSLIIPADAVTSEERFRQLRVRLRQRSVAE